nr:hypothetical protein GCM10020093_000580 [Planobispora longispora]
MSDSFESIVDAFQPVRPQPGNLPGPAARVILVLCWLAVGLLPILLAVGDVKLAAGTVGTPGTLTVVSCEDLGKGRYDCRGSFAPDGGGAAIPVAASPDSEAGDVTRAQLAPRATARSRRARPAWSPRSPSPSSGSPDWPSCPT